MGRHVFQCKYKIDLPSSGVQCLDKAVVISYRLRKWPKAFLSSEIRNCTDLTTITELA